MLTGLWIGRIALFALFALVSLAAPGPAQRIHSRLDDRETFSLPGNTYPAVAHNLAKDLGPVNRSRKMPGMSLHFTMTPAQSADLDRLLVAQQDRRSPQYHKFLTPEEFAARFGPASSDIAKVIAWLEESGFSAVQVARGGMWVSFSGTAAEAEAAFHVSLRNYSLHGETHFANSSDPQLPKALAGFVSHVRGLHNFPCGPMPGRSIRNII